jgi:hypothetical protein
MVLHKNRHIDQWNIAKFRNEFLYLWSTDIPQAYLGNSLEK